MQKRRKTRLGVQQLETRETPAVFIVTTYADVVNPADGRLSLREAVSRANATAEADTIVLQTGVYKISLAGAGDDLNATGDFDITNPLTIVGQGAGRTAIDGNKLDRVLDFLSSADAKLANLTLRNGSTAFQGGGLRSKDTNLQLNNCRVIGNSSLQEGGGIRSSGGNLVVVGSLVSDNVGGKSGGGILTEILTLRNSVVRNNRTGAGGGGISAIVATVINSTVSGNSAPNGLGGGMTVSVGTLTGSIVRGNSAADDGGGIWAQQLELTNCAVDDNITLKDGGGIASSSVKLKNSAVRGNFAARNGGGISASNATIVSSTLHKNSAVINGGGMYASLLELTGSAVSANSAFKSGGGIFILPGNPFSELTNSTLSGNRAVENGGGIHAESATLTNCTITLNHAFNFGGGVFSAAGPGQNFNVKNTIIAQNTTLSGFTPDVIGSFVSAGNNLIGAFEGSLGFSNGAKGDQVGTTENPIDARLAPLANNGGPTKTHALRAGSKAIDKGDNSVTVTADQRGRVRRKDGDGNGVAVVDIGAFER